MKLVCKGARWGSPWGRIATSVVMSDNRGSDTANPIRVHNLSKACKSSLTFYMGGGGQPPRWPGAI